MLMRTALGFLFLASGLAGSALADEVRLKDGRVVKGVIIEDSRALVRLETPDGKVQRFRRDEIQSVVESYEIGSEELDPKLAEARPGDISAYLDIAREAKEQKVAGWHLIARIVLRLEPASSGAHELLDHIQVGDKWYETKAEAEKARAEELEKRLLEEGYVKWRGGWIKKDDREDATRNSKAFIKTEDNIWRREEDVMKEKGLVKIGDKWVKGPNEEDRAEMERFEKLTGEKIFVITTAHFQLLVQQYEPEKIMEFGELMDKVYTWFHEEFRVPKGEDVFRGNKPNIWILKDIAAAQDWFKHYEKRYGFDDKPEDPGYVPKMLKSSGGNFHSSSRWVATAVPRQTTDIRNQLVHIAGHFLMDWLQLGRRPAWVSESFGHYAEHVHQDNGVVICSTHTRYGQGGGMADKQFTTADAKNRAKFLARMEQDRPFGELNRVDLNSLNGDDLTKGWTLYVWLMKEHREGFLKLLEVMRKADSSESENWLATVMASLPHCLNGWSPEDLDREWRKWVKANS